MWKLMNHLKTSSIRHSWKLCKESMKSIYLLTFINRIQCNNPSRVISSELTITFIKNLLKHVYPSLIRRESILNAFKSHVMYTSSLFCGCHYRRELSLWQWIKGSCHCLTEVEYACCMIAVSQGQVWNKPHKRNKYLLLKNTTLVFLSLSSIMTNCITYACMQFLSCRFSLPNAHLEPHKRRPKCLAWHSKRPRWINEKTKAGG